MGMSRDDVIGLFVLMAIGAIIASLMNQASALASGFTTFHNVWSWALANAYGMDSSKKSGNPVQQKNIQPSKGNPRVSGRGDLAP